MPRILEETFGPRIWNWFTENINVKLKEFKWKPETGLMCEEGEEQTKAIDVFLAMEFLKDSMINLTMDSEIESERKTFLFAFAKEEITAKDAESALEMMSQSFFRSRANLDGKSIGSNVSRLSGISPIIEDSKKSGIRTNS